MGRERKMDELDLNDRNENSIGDQTLLVNLS